MVNIIQLGVCKFYLLCYFLKWKTIIDAIRNQNWMQLVIHSIESTINNSSWQLLQKWSEKIASAFYEFSKLLVRGLMDKRQWWWKWLHWNKLQLVNIV